VNDLQFRCPSTAKPITTSFRIDHATLVRSWSDLVRIHCPHCGEEHQIPLRDGYMSQVLGSARENENLIPQYTGFEPGPSTGRSLSKKEQQYESTKVDAFLEVGRQHAKRDVKTAGLRAQREAEAAPASYLAKAVPVR
jgi:hypothetical protein